MRDAVSKLQEAQQTFDQTSPSDIVAYRAAAIALYAALSAFYPPAEMQMRGYDTLLTY